MNALILLGLCLTGQDSPREFDFRLVETGLTSRLKDRGTMIIRTEDQYRSYLRRRGSEVKRSPQVDFAKEQLVAIHVGEAPSAGYSLRVKRLLRRAGNVTDAEIILERPAPGLMTASVITYPFVVVRTERFPGTVNIKVVEPDAGEPGR